MAMASSSGKRAATMAPAPHDQVDRHVKRKTCDLDFDTLECPVCTHLLSPPVFQCYNGHTVCASCCALLTKKQCPSCSLPIGNYRCITVEKIVESLQVMCKHAGCNEKLHYINRENHEEVCEYRSFYCPLVVCPFASCACSQAVLRSADTGAAMAMASSSGKRAATMAPAPHDQVDRHVKRKTCDLDFDTLECPVCTHLFSPPVFQCYNGHTVCASCCALLTKKQCPSCSLPIENYRCITVEKIVESLQVMCKHAGCNEKLHYTNRENHEEVCEYRSFYCPLVGCPFEGHKAEIMLHLQNNHGAVIFTMQPKTEKILMLAPSDFSGRIHHVIVQASQDTGMFLLHHGFDEEFRRYSFFCTSFGACNKFYRLFVRVDRQGATHSYSIEAPVSDNQFDKGWLKKMERCSDFLTISPLSENLELYNETVFEVELELL